MFRRLARARRRVPVQSAGHDSSDRSEPNAREEEPSPHVYHTCLGTDGPVPLLIEGLARDQRLKRPEILRHHARSLVSHVNQEERNAAQAWSRLRQLYDVFRAIQTAQEKSELGQLEPDDDDDVLASLLANGDANDTVLNDFHELTSQLPEGFSSQMFADLGNALYSEMQQQQHQQPRGISRQSLETLGDHLLSQSASVAASPRSSSSSIVSVSVSA
jgi:hypothetical protein